MSTVKANNVQVGQSGTATNNFTLYQPSSPDGTVRLAVGNSGATSADVLTANSSGNVGIGTSSPGQRLELASSGDVTLRLRSSAGTNDAVADITGYSDALQTGGITFSTRNAGTLAERMRITSSGNVGVGVTPSAWNTVTPIQVKNASFAGYSTTNAYMLQNAYYASGWKYISNGGAARFEINGSSYEWSGAASGTAGNAITFTPILSIDKDKTLALQGATSATGIGIAFPATQSASSDANTLDDYEEGTFTPTVLGSTTAGTGTYTYQVGTYVKVGQLVSVSCLIEITNHTGTGNLRFGNLPFATSNSNSLNRYGGAIGSLNNLALTASNVALLHAQNNSTEMLMLQYPVGGGGQTDVPMDTSFGISFTFTYRCSA